MKRSKTRWLLAGVLSLLLWPAGCSTRWENLNTSCETSIQEGHYGEAEKQCQAALKEAENFFEFTQESSFATELRGSLGEKDQRLVTSLNNLALLYDAQGNYAQAEPLYQRAIVIDEKGLGPYHPDLAIDLLNLATLYGAQGKYAEAEPLFMRSLTIYEVALGPDHPNVAKRILDKYAVLLRKMDRDAEAEKVEARAKAIRTKHAQENPQR